jgi:glyoxylase-like metal-dependent hydrolase (beta-lactamase superfamily II)
MEIVPGVHRIDGVRSNCYALIRDGLILIDTGMPNSTKKILAYIQNTLKCTPSDLTTIILTHYHMDHVGNVSALVGATGAKVAIHEADADFVTGRRSQPAPRGLTGMLFKGVTMFIKSRPAEPDILLKNGDTINGLTCIHTPGHTPGSICLLDSASQVLFAGDLIRFNGSILEGPPAQFTPDMTEVKRSIARIAALDFDILLPGHGVPLAPGAAERVRAFAQTFR